MHGGIEHYTKICSSLYRIKPLKCKSWSKIWTTYVTPKMINLTPINSMMIAGNATELVHDVVTLDDATTVKDHDEV